MADRNTAGAGAHKAGPCDSGVGARFIHALSAATGSREILPV